MSMNGREVRDRRGWVRGTGRACLTIGKWAVVSGAVLRFTMDIMESWFFGTNLLGPRNVPLGNNFYRDSCV